MPNRTAEDTFTSRRISAKGIALICRFEGCAQLATDGMVDAYPDPATGGPPWTIGWGATGRDRARQLQRRPHSQGYALDAGTVRRAARRGSRQSRR